MQNEPPPPAPPVQVVKEVIVERVPAPPVIEVDEETKQIMQGVQGTVAQLVEHEEWNGDQLEGIRTQVDTVLQELRQLPKPATPLLQPPSPARSLTRVPSPLIPAPLADPTPQIDVTPITERLDEMGMALNTNLPELFAKVEELMKQAAALQQTKSVIMVKDLPKAAPTPQIPQGESEPIEGLPKTEENAPSTDTQEEADSSEAPPSPGIPEGGEAEAVEVPTKLELFDPTQLEAKLDALMTLCQELRVVPQPQVQPRTPVVGESPKTPVPDGDGVTAEQIDAPASSVDGEAQPAPDLVSQDAEVSQLCG